MVMRTRRIALVAVLVGMMLVELPSRAQFRVQPPSEAAGQLGLGLMLRRLATVGVFMQATAHPDDEFNELLVMYGRGIGYRTILATATRGDGGQNEIGPELFEALGVLRTEELEAMHRFDGAEQYFTRAVDFGYSFSIEETFEKWGRDEITGDYVRLIRTLRPDVILGMSPQGTGGGQHHQASAVLSREAARAAADPSRYPEQIQQGLRPWQVKKYYLPARFGGPGGAPTTRRSGGGLCRIDTSIFDTLLGKTYVELGSEARSMHMCQGMAQLLALPGVREALARAPTYQLVDTTIPAQLAKEETSLFDGIDTSLEGLVQYVKGQPPRALVAGLAAISKAVQDAAARVTDGGPEAAGPALAAGLSRLRTLRGQLASMDLDEAARYEIDARLAPKAEDFQRALLLAYNARVETLADDGVVISGQPVTVSVLAAVRGKAPAAVKSIAFAGFDGSAACTVGPIQNGLFRCESQLRIPANPRITAPYWKRLPNAARDEFEADVPF